MVQSECRSILFKAKAVLLWELQVLATMFLQYSFRDGNISILGIADARARSAEPARAKNALSEYCEL